MEEEMQSSPTVAVGSKDEVTETTVDSELQFGYTVGIDKDGKFVFDLHGNNGGFVQLLGLTKFADQQITRMMDSSLGRGTPAVEVGLVAVYKKLDEILKALQTKQDG